jgi:dTMP kinase
VEVSEVLVDIINTMEGKFITLYGINNIGKTTHAKRLVKRINDEGGKAVHIKYPVYDLAPTGPFINEVLRGGEQSISEDELQMWFVLNRCQNQNEIRRLLDEGHTIVAEDYTGTGIAWGVAKGLELEWLESLNKHLIKEDLSILFEGERDVTAKEDIHVHEQNDELIERCRIVHSELADKYNWQRLQVCPTMDETANSLWKLIIDAQ